MARTFAFCRWEYDLDGRVVNPLGSAIKWSLSLLHDFRTPPASIWCLRSGHATESITAVKPGEREKWLLSSLTRDRSLLLICGRCPHDLLESFTSEPCPRDSWEQLEQPPWDVPKSGINPLKDLITGFDVSVIFGHDAQFALTICIE